MSRKQKHPDKSTLLELWRPPAGAGDPLGCLATTYTFAPGLFDEQCLARFLEIESEPNREDLAFLLERETRLGGVYAGVMVDESRAGVEHSLRWDVLPVRIRGAKQHAKLSLLAWERHVRVIVASANLSEPGYRTNHEVAVAVQLSPAAADLDLLAAATGFLRSLLSCVRMGKETPPEVRRARDFLTGVEERIASWATLPRRERGEKVRQQLVCTLPAVGVGQEARSSLIEAVEWCRRRGASPSEVRVASPFFDPDPGSAELTAALCKLMARGDRRHLWFAVPAVRNEGGESVPRIAAPKSLVHAPLKYQGEVRVALLPEQDEEGNPRVWHAKMLALQAEPYSALMVGSSNFTGAGLGIGHARNAEANLLTVVDREAYGRETGRLEDVWPEMEPLADPEAAEWLGTRATGENEDDSEGVRLPDGFFPATFCAGEPREIILRFDPEEAGLPTDWEILTYGEPKRELMSSSLWLRQGRPANAQVPWAPAQPPERLLVHFAGGDAFLPLNVLDVQALPPPAQLDRMSADDVLLLLAAADPSAACRAWATRQQKEAGDDSELDSATPVDLNPLGRYDLEATFLHRIRRRAHVLAQLQANLQRPVWGKPALEWRLRGSLGVGTLAGKMVRELESAGPAGSAEALLAIADFLIVLREVQYDPGEGAISPAEFTGVFRPFLRELADRIHGQVRLHLGQTSSDIAQFWERVVESCRM